MYFIAYEVIAEDYAQLNIQVDVDIKLNVFYDTPGTTSNTGWSQWLQ